MAPASACAHDPSASRREPTRLLGGAVHANATNRIGSVIVWFQKRRRH